VRLPGGVNLIAVKADGVREIFLGLESGDGSVFFKHVAEDVDWIVMGTLPLAGHNSVRRRSSTEHSRSWPKYFRAARNSIRSI
jgi:ketosteroid isomerase-like protein